VLVEEVAEQLDRQVADLEVREVDGEPGQGDLVVVDRVLGLVGPPQRFQVAGNVAADCGLFIRFVLHGLLAYAGGVLDLLEC
jgi:hypothetical protein